MTGDRVQQAWQTAGEGGGRLPLDEVRQRANAFHRTIWRRNLIEYVAAAVVFAWSGARAFGADDAVTLTGNILLARGALVVAGQRHRRGSAPVTGSAEPVMV